MLEIIGFGSAIPPVEALPPQKLEPSSSPGHGQTCIRGTAVHGWRPVSPYSPTDLAYAAATQALERAGVAVDKIGLILGDCATPRETTPSEAQRLGKRLGLKVPAYDIGAGSAAFVNFIEVLSNWKAERIPEHVLLVSSNCMEENISETSLPLPGTFCDAAAACVVSLQHRGKLEVTKVKTEVVPAPETYIGIDTYGFLSIGQKSLESLNSLMKRLCLEALSQAEKGAALIASFVTPQLAEEFRKEPSMKKNLKWFEDVVSKGDSLGSTIGRIVAERWDELNSGDEVALVAAGSGSVAGYCILKVR